MKKYRNEYEAYKTLHCPNKGLTLEHQTLKTTSHRADAAVLVLWLVIIGIFGLICKYGGEAIESTEIVCMER